MNIKNCPDLDTDHRREGDQTDSQPFDGKDIDIGPQEITHQNPGAGNTKDQNQREKVIDQRNIFYMAVDNTPTSGGGALRASPSRSLSTHMTGLPGKIPCP